MAMADFQLQRDCNSGDGRGAMAMMKLQSYDDSGRLAMAMAMLEFKRDAYGSSEIGYGNREASNR